MAEKLIYGLDKVHFAPVTVEADGSITFGTPMRLYGATEFKASPAGESVKIYADNGVYYEVSANQGYEVELSIHNVPREFETHALGVVYDEENGTMTEVANAKGGAFALLWEFETDQSPTRHLFYNCTATRGDIESKSLEDKIDASPTTLKITASPIELDGEKIVKVRTVASESPSAKAIYDNWYKTVFRKGEISNSEELPQPQTADVTFDLTTPTKGAGNTISGGGATKTVTVNVANQTQSVVLSVTKTAQQTLRKSGTDSDVVNNSGDTVTVDTSTIAADGGTKTFALTVSETGKTSIKYDITLTVAGAGV